LKRSPGAMNVESVARTSVSVSTVPFTMKADPTNASSHRPKRSKKRTGQTTAISFSSNKRARRHRAERLPTSSGKIFSGS